MANKRKSTKPATKAQKEHRKRFAAASKTCTGMTKDRRAACMRRELKKKPTSKR